MSPSKELALIGATASGKSALAVKIALDHNAVIFSIDSLSVYKEMDIVSAKPSIEERQGVIHFGIDLLDISESFSAARVADVYREAKAYAQTHHKNLIIVGGSSFYLKALIDGLSKLPEFSSETVERVQAELLDLPKCHALLSALDPDAVTSIAPQDRYRLEKLLLIYYQTGQKPSDYFQDHAPVPVIEKINIFEIFCEREVLRERITKRTRIMLDQGLIDEIADLELRYGRAHAPMKAIGVIETLEYLDGILDKKALEEAITTHTAQLAKRQTTFNKTQFEHVTRAPIEALDEEMKSFFTQPS